MPHYPTNVLYKTYIYLSNISASKPPSPGFVKVLFVSFIRKFVVTLYKIRCDKKVNKKPILKDYFYEIAS